MAKGGLLRDRLDFQTFAPTQDDTGQVIENWNTVQTVWGQIMDLSGREYLSRNDLEVAVSTTRVYVRDLGTRVTPRDRFVDKSSGVIYEVVHVAHLVKRHLFDCYCTTVFTDG